MSDVWFSESEIKIMETSCETARLALDVLRDNLIDDAKRALLFDHVKAVLGYLEAVTLDLMKEKLDGLSGNGLGGADREGEEPND